MSTQLLVNVLEVTALGVGATITLPHGLKSNNVSVAPTLIQPDRGTPIIVFVLTDTEVTFKNMGGSPESAKFRCEYGLSNELDSTTITPLLWQGVTVGGGGGGVTGVTATAPLASSGGAIPNISLGVSANFVAGATLDLSNTGVAAAAYGNLAAANQSSVPTFTVDAKGRITTANSGPIQIGGSDAKTYVNAQDAATLASANAYAQTLAFSISSKEPAHVATAAALDPNTKVGITLVANSNGVFPPVDGETVTINQRVLVKNEADTTKNGIYYLKVVGTGATPWVLERTADADTAAELCGSIIPVDTGTLSGTVWIFSANSTTFVEWTSPVVWSQLSVGSATTMAQGIVQLADGLGGLNTTASNPRLNVDYASSGTLASVRGGTGFGSYVVGEMLQGNGGNLVKLSPGAANKFLRSNGPGNALSYESISATDIPAIKMARTYYVSATGNDVSGDGSINKPFATVGKAVQQASTDFPGNEAVEIFVGPGTYGPTTINRPNVFIQGAGSSPEGQATKLFAISVASIAGTTLFNDQISISGCFITVSGSGNTIDVASTVSPLTITITNCYIANGINAGFSAALYCASASKIVIRSSAINQSGTSSTAQTFYMGAGDLRVSDCQLIRTGSAGGLIYVGPNASAFCDRVLMECITAGYAIDYAGASFGTLPYKLLLVNSSLTGSGAISAGVTSSGVAAATPSVVLNTVFTIPVAQNILNRTVGTLIYGNLTCTPGSSTQTAGTLTPYNEVHGEIYIPSLAASSIVKTDANKKLTTGTITGADFGSQTANTFFAAPNGSAGNPTFRAIVAADIPSLPASKITSIPYDVAGSLAGQWQASPNNEIFWFKATRAFLVSSTAADHKFTARTASTGSPTFTLYKNTVGAGNEVLTAQFSTSATGTVTMSGTSANYSLAADDVLILVAPAAVDATLANIFWTIAATLNP